MPRKKRPKPAPRPPRPPGATSAVGLSYREVRFVNFYLEHGNATQAARDAGYTLGAGAEDDVQLRKLASDLLTKPYVAAYYAECLGAYLDAERITVPKLAQSYAWEAFADRSGIVDPVTGLTMNPCLWPVELRSLLIAYDQVTTTDPKTREVVTRHHVKLVGMTEAKRVLAEWKGMIGAKATDAGSGTTQASVTVILEADPPADADEAPLFDAEGAS